MSGSKKPSIIYDRQLYPTSNESRQAHALSFSFFVLLQDYLVWFFDLFCLFKFSMARFVVGNVSRSSLLVVQPIRVTY